MGPFQRSLLQGHARFAGPRELIFTEITATDEAGKVLAHGLRTYRIA